MRPTRHPDHSSPSNAAKKMIYIGIIYTILPLLAAASSAQQPLRHNYSEYLSSSEEPGHLESDGRYGASRQNMANGNEYTVNDAQRGAIAQDRIPVPCTLRQVICLICSAETSFILMLLSLAVPPYDTPEAYYGLKTFAHIPVSSYVWTFGGHALYQWLDTDSLV